jgi:hypothetical protein
LIIQDRATAAWSKIHQAIWTTQLLERYRTPVTRRKFEDSCGTRFFRQGFAGKRTGRRNFQCCYPSWGRQEILQRLKTLMLSPEGLVPWYRAFSSPHRCELFFPISEAFFSTHENKNNRFKISSLQSISAGQSCRWVSMFGY